MKIFVTVLGKEIIFFCFIFVTVGYFCVFIFLKIFVTTDCKEIIFSGRFFLDQKDFIGFVTECDANFNFKNFIGNIVTCFGNNILINPDYIFRIKK